MLTGDIEPVRFRIRKARGAWRVEWWDDQHALGHDWAGWSPAFLT